MINEEQRPMRIEVPPPRGVEGRFEEVQTTQPRPAPSQPKHEVEKSAHVLSRGAMAEAIGGALAVVLVIFGLAEVAPFWMTAFATLFLGAAVLLRAAAIAARYSRLLEETTSAEAGTTDLTSGMGVEFLGGAAGIFLAILAMIGLVPWVLLPVAVIVYGGTLLVSSGATARLNTLAIDRSRAVSESKVSAQEVVTAAAGTQVLIGLTAIILGILALIGINPVVLTLVGVLCLGASILLSGVAIGSRMMSIFR